jgi:hypothetical protein
VDAGVLEGEGIDAWLSDSDDMALLKSLLMPYAGSSQQCWAVSRNVNSPANDGPELIEETIGEDSAMSKITTTDGVAGGLGGDPAQVVRSPVYANGVHLALTAVDCQMGFSRNVLGYDSVVQTEVTVVVPFVVLKSLSEVLPPLVEGIEKETGTIRVPEATRALRPGIDKLLAPLRKAAMTE